MLIGITDERFWHMDFEELETAFEVYNETRKRQHKETLNYLYVLADMIGISNSRNHSKDSRYPEFSEMFPNLFGSQELSEDEEERRNQRNVANFLSFANAFNQQYKEQKDD